MGEGFGEVFGEFIVLELIGGLRGRSGEGGEVGFVVVAGLGEDAFSEHVEGAGSGEALEKTGPVGDALAGGDVHGGEEGFLEAVGGIGFVGEETEGGLPDYTAMLGD